MTAFFDFVSAWYKKPFDANGSILTWALFVLLILVLCGIWASVLSHLKPVVKAATEAV